MRYSTTQERIAIIENFLTQKLAEGKLQTDKPTEAIIQNILQNHKGIISIQKIAKEFGISQRQLERQFSSQKVGVSPKFFCRIIRLQNVVNTIRNEKSERPLKSRFVIWLLQSSSF